MKEIARPLRVLQVCAVSYTVCNFLLPLVNHLHQAGYEVDVACSDGPMVPELRRMGVSIQCIKIERKIASLQHLKALFDLYRLIRKKQYDIVHVHSSVAAILGRVAARLAGTRMIVYTAHGFYFHEGMRPGVRFIFMNIEKIMGRWFSDLIFTQSQEDYDTAIKEKVIPAEKLHYIGNGVDFKNFTVGTASKWRTAVRKELNLGRFDRIVGFVGRLVREKGVIDLIDAFRIVHERMPTAGLLIVGEIGQGDRDTLTEEILQEKIVGAGLVDHVIFTGYRQDVNRLMSVMDVFVLPSYREGLPRSIIEAMAMGLPVVATDIRGCREEVVEGKTGLLTPKKNAENMGKCIIEIITDNEKMANFGKEGLERARMLFDEKIVLEKQSELLERYANQLR